MAPRRGQTVSMDLVLSCVVFGIILAYLVNALNEGYQDVSTGLLLDDISTRTIQVSRLLFETPGTPTDWEEHPSDATTIGLAPFPGEISTRKLSALGDVPYEKLKTLAKSGGYEVYIVVTTTNGRELGKAGHPPAGMLAVSREVLATCDGQACKARVTLWTRNAP